MGATHPQPTLPLDHPLWAARSCPAFEPAPRWSGVGSIPFVPGASARGLLVEHGVVTASSTSPSGRTAGVALLGSGDLWTDDASMCRSSDDEGTRLEALCPSRVRVLTNEALSRAAADASSVPWMIWALARRARDAERRCAEALCLPVEERVLSLLRRLARLQGVAIPGGIRIELELSQERIARLTGASRESINRAMRTLRQRGDVRRDGLHYEVAGGGS